MNTRLPHTLPGPKLETRDSDAPTPCLKTPEPFDVLMERKSGWDYVAALPEAVYLCGTCPIRDTCLTANANDENAHTRQWSRAVIRELARRKGVAA